MALVSTSTHSTVNALNLSLDPLTTAAAEFQPTRPYIFHFSKDFMFYVLAIILPTGLLCNTLSILVFMTKALRNRAASWYLAALAVSDDLALLTMMVDYWLKDERIGVNTIQKSEALCILVTYLSYTTRLLSAWLVTAFTIERFIGVVYPLQRAALSTTSHARKVIISQTCACFVLTSFTLFTIGVVKVPYGTDCDVRPDMVNVYLVFNILFVIFGSIVVPILIICTLNMFILSKVYQRRRNFVPRNMRFNGRRAVSYKSAKDYNIATLLLVVSTAFVLLNVPYCICWFVLFFHHFNLIGPFGPDAIWQLYAAKYITSVPYYLNYSINFGLYNLCARAFRTQLSNLLHCKTCEPQALVTQEQPLNLQTVTKAEEGDALEKEGSIHGAFPAVNARSTSLSASQSASKSSGRMRRVLDKCHVDDDEKESRC